MVEENQNPVVPAAESPEKKKNEEVVLEVKKSKGTYGRPSISEMVDAAIFALNERGGSSFAAIKKYIAATFKTDAKKSAPYIKRYIIESVDSDHLIQAKGSGASGSFKLSAEAKRLAERSAGITSKTYLPKKQYKYKKTVKTHPPYYEMIDTAVIALNEKYGSSLQAIKKYLAEHYNIDTKKKALHIKRYVNSALDNGQYVQSAGSGASGRVRIAHDENDRKQKSEKKEKKADKPVAAKKKTTNPKPLGRPKGKASTKKAAPKSTPVTPKKKRPEPKKRSPIAPKAKSATGKRGRPTKDKAESPAKKSKTETPVKPVAKKASKPEPPAKSPEKKASPEKRGRPPKNASPAKKSSPAKKASATSSSPGKRGRPSKKK